MAYLCIEQEYLELIQDTSKGVGISDTLVSKEIFLSDFK